MNKIVRFHAALIMMCVIAFSVSLGSCDKNEVDNQDENSLSLKVDTNGVNFTLTPLINWKANLTDVEKYMAKYFPGFNVCDDGELEYNENCDDWALSYENDGNMRIFFLFRDEQGNALDMVEFDFFSSCNADNIRAELSRLGLKYKGLLYWDRCPQELIYMYLSNDEKLEVQFDVHNCGDEDYWFLSFQPFDKDDLDHMIDESSVEINITTDEDSYTLIPLLDWSASFDDVIKYMEDNYPQWENTTDYELEADSVSGDTVRFWYTAYSMDSLRVAYCFTDAEGEGYCQVQYSYYSSSDLYDAKCELTRNGLVFIGHDPGTYEGQISNYVYAPLSREYMVGAASWELFGGAWSVSFCQYDEDYIDEIKKN